MTASEIITLLGEICALLGIIAGWLVSIGKVRAGIRCILRSEMLHIYYRHVDSKEIRQYEYENFIHLYEAYKKLKGNSFIEKIHEEVKKFKIIT